MSENNEQNESQPQTFGYDNIDISLPEDLVVPQIEEIDDSKIYKNKIEDDLDVSFKFCFIGAGQAGSRIAQTFNKLGYNRVAVINTAEQDLNSIDVEKKLCIGEGGAGKQPELAKIKYQENKEDVLDFLRYSFGEEWDRIFVCAGGGGGSGGGMLEPLVQTAHELSTTLKLGPQKVGVILTLPRHSEGAKVRNNASKALNDAIVLAHKGLVSPLIVLDNEKISQLYPNLSIANFWNTANSSLAGLFHLFNLTSNKDSSYSSFDKSDYQTILDSGVVAFGVAQVKQWDDPVALSRIIRDNIKNSLLAGSMDLSTANIAGVITIASEKILNELSQSHMDQALEHLNKTMRTGSTLHSGIYSGDKDSMNLFIAIGGLTIPGPQILSQNRRR
jgi:cell division GTPase FtsZ